MELIRKYVRSHQWQVRNEFGYLDGKPNKVSFWEIESDDKSIVIYRVTIWWRWAAEPHEHFYTDRKEAEKEYDDLIDRSVRDRKVYSQEELKKRWNNSDAMTDMDYEDAKREYEMSHALICGQTPELKE